MNRGLTMEDKKITMFKFRISSSKQNDSKYFSKHRFIGLVGRVFTNGPVDRGSIPGRVIPKT